MSLTPMQIEKRLTDLSREIDETNTELINCEQVYHVTKASYEIALAKSRMEWAFKSAPNGKNYTVGEKESLVLLDNAEQHMQLAIVEAQVKSARANTNKIRTQVDIARTLSVSVRSSMDIG